MRLFSISFFSILITLLIIFLTGWGSCDAAANANKAMSAKPSSPAEIIDLPEPDLSGTVSLEESLLQRRSIRNYSERPLKIKEISQLLWAAQGISGENGSRTAPSAGGLYPLEIYLVTGNVEGLLSGVYKYLVDSHNLLRASEGDKREQLAKAALNQLPVKEGAVDIVIAAVYERLTSKYGERGIRYTQIEVGHVAQNICLEATVLDLGVVSVGAFDDNQVKRVLDIPDEETPLYIIPVGRKD